MFHLYQLSPNQSLGGYVLIKKDPKDCRHWQVHIKLKNDAQWTSLPVKEGCLLRDGGSIIIQLKPNSLNIQNINLPLGQPQAWYLSLGYSGPHFFLDSYQTQETVLQGFSDPLPDLPEIDEGSITHDRYHDLTQALQTLLAPHGLSCTDSDIFEHLLLRQAKTDFNPNYGQSFSSAKVTPDYFYINLKLKSSLDNPNPTLKQFVTTLNQKYGKGTAVYMPNFDSNGRFAIRLNLHTVIHQVLPEIKRDLVTYISDKETKLFYQFAKERPLLTQFLSSTTFFKPAPSPQAPLSSCPCGISKEDLVTVFHLTQEQSNAIQGLKEGLTECIEILTNSPQIASEIVDVMRGPLEKKAQQALGGLISTDFCHHEKIQISFKAKESLQALVKEMPRLEATTHSMSLTG
jgi:hypothetical protein